MVRSKRPHSKRASELGIGGKEWEAKKVENAQVGDPEALVISFSRAEWLHQVGYYLYST
jgi:hypothetical protein